jgi:Secretion system C-terminal sorting domain
LNFKEIAILAPDTQQFTNIPLVEGVTYFYRIRASNTFGFSTYTKAVSATSIVTKAPNAPFFLNAVASAVGQVSLSWSDGSNNETKFEIERSIDNVTFAKIGETLTDVITYVDKSVADNTLYYYRVRAVNSLGNSGYATASVTTLKKTSAFVVSNDAAISVYPNPTVNLVKISLPEAANENATIRVIDRNSREVMRKNTTTNSFGEINLDLSNMPEGTYTINIQTETSVVSKRVVKY